MDKQTEKAIERLERASWDSRATPLRADITALLDHTRAMRSALSALVHDIDDLVANSEGVAGLHLNGDVADWGSLLPGGYFGAWLASMEDARTYFCEHQPKEPATDRFDVTVEQTPVWPKEPTPSKEGGEV